MYYFSEVVKEDFIFVVEVRDRFIMVEEFFEWFYFSVLQW